MLYADGKGVVVSTGPIWWPFYWPWYKSSNCSVNSIWGPFGGVITGTSSNGGFAAAEASARSLAFACVHAGHLLHMFVR